MALGQRLIKSDFGIKVLSQVIKGTYITPTEILCLEKDKVDLPNIEYETGEFFPMDDASFDYIKDGDDAKVTWSADFALPLFANMGGLHDLFLACGVVDGGTVTKKSYTPKVDMGSQAVSMEVTTKRRVYQIKDVQGTFVVSNEPSEMVRVKFELTGTLNATVVQRTPVEADNTIPTSPLQPSDMFWGRKKCGITVGVNQMRAKNYELNLGRSIETDMTYCGNAVYDTNFKPTFKMLMKVTEENEAPIDDMRNATEYAIDIPMYDTDGVNAGQIQVPKGRVSTPDSESDNNGYWEVERTFSPRKTTGDDHFTLVIGV